MPKKAEAKVRIRVTDGGDLKKIQKGSRQADRALKGTARTSSSATKNFSKMSQGITGGLVPAYATLAANLFAITAIFGALKEAANLRVMREGMIEFANSTGVAMQSISRGLERITHGQLDYGEAMKATAVLSAAGFNTEMIMEMGEASRQASSALGHNFEDAFSRITKGIQKAEPELLDELGIILRLDEATRKFADANNMNQKDLTLYQKTLAVHNEVMGQVADKYGQLENEPAVSAMNQMATAFENIKKGALEGIAPIAEFFAGTFAKHIKLVVISMAFFAVSIMKAAGLGDMLKSKMTASLDAATTKANRAKVAMKGYADQMRRVSGSIEERGAMAEGGLTKMGQSERIMKGQRGKGADLLRSGRVDLIAKDKRILMNWKKSAKLHIGITKNMTEEERLDFEQWVNDMLLDHGKMVDIASRAAKKTVLVWDYAWTGLKRGATSAFGMIGKGFGKLASGAMKLLSFMGWVGMLTMAYTMIKEFWSDIDKTVETFIEWGKSLQEMTEDRFPRFSKWIGKMTEQLDKQTEAWRQQIAVMRELEDWANRIDESMETMTETNIEAAFIAEKLKQTLDKPIEEGGGQSLQLFIKRMKLIESVSIKNVFEDATTAMNAMNKAGGGAATEMVKRWGNLIKPGKEYGKVIQDVAGKTKDLTDVAAGAPSIDPRYYKHVVVDVGEEKRAETAQSQTDRDDWDNLNDQLTRYQEEIPNILEGIGQLSKLKESMRKAGTPGDVLDAFMPEDAATRVRDITAELDFGLITHEEFGTKVSKILTDLGLDYDKFSKDIAAPGKTMESLSELTAQYNKEFAGMKQKGMPKEWGKLGNIFQGVLTEMHGITDETLLKQKLDAQTISLMTQMGIKLEGINNLSEARIAIEARYAEIMAIAWGFEKKVMERRMQGVQRAGQGVAKQLGGPLGADIKQTEKIAVLNESILDNQSNINQLKAQEALIDDNVFASRMMKLKLEKSQLERNLEVTKEGYSLSFKLVNTFQQSFTNLFEEIAKGEKKIGDIFKDVTKQMLVQMAQMMAQMAAIAAMKAMFGPTMFGIPIGREGGVFSPPGYKSFAGGGVSSGPNSGYLATLHGSEAVVPLGNDKSIPVKFEKGSGNVSNITVNVAAGGQQQTTTTKAGEKERRLGQLVAAAVQAEILDQQRPGGILSPYGDGGI